MVAKIGNFALEDRDLDNFVGSMPNLPPHPEVPEALERLRSAGFRMVRKFQRYPYLEYSLDIRDIILKYKEMAPRDAAQTPAQVLELSGVTHQPAVRATPAAAPRNMGCDDLA
jgi:hypothetical protein